MDLMTIEDRDGVRWITFRGELDQSEVLQVKSEFDDAVADAKGDVVLDLGLVTFIGTLGIGLLVSTREQLIKRGRKLKLTQVPEAIEKTFETMTLTEVFERV